MRLSHVLTCFALITVVGVSVLAGNAEAVDIENVPGADSSVLKRPAGIAVNPENEDLYISDSTKRVVYRIRDGKPTIHVGTPDEKCLDINLNCGDGGHPLEARISPAGITFITHGELKGSLLIADTTSHSVRIVTPDGKKIESFFRETIGDRPPEITSFEGKYIVSSVTLSSDGALYVLIITPTKLGNAGYVFKVQIYDDTGRLLTPMKRTTSTIFNPSSIQPDDLTASDSNDILPSYTCPLGLTSRGATLFITTNNGIYKYSSKKLSKYASTHINPTISSQIGISFGVVWDPENHCLTVADARHQKIWRISHKDGKKMHIAGIGKGSKSSAAKVDDSKVDSQHSQFAAATKPALEANLVLPYALAAGKHGIYITDYRSSNVYLLRYQ